MNAKKVPVTCEIKKKYSKSIIEKQINYHILQEKMSTIKHLWEYFQGFFFLILMTYNICPHTI